MAKTIGIDLGTTNSCVAVIEGGEPVVIANAEGARTTPSVVAFSKTGERMIGQVAKRQAITNPDRTISSIKREMGTDHKVTIDGKHYTPQEISAMILQKLKADAEAYLGEPVTSAVITVPAYFTDAQRQATKDAGKIAGLDVKRIINEPTAAALSYGIDKEEDQKIMVYDLGGGTFDVSIIEMGDGVQEVLATAGNNRLGGDDFDKRIMDWIVGSFKVSDGIDLSGDKMAMQRIKEAAEKAKIELSGMTSASINLPFITADASGPKHLDLTLSRAKFNELTADLVESTMGPVRQALSDSGLSINEINKVLMVGGSSRIPAVQEAVKKLIGKEQHITITSSSNMSKEDIDKAVKAAEQFAEEDKKRREEVEMKNNAENMCYAADKLISDNGDKIDEADKNELNSKSAALRSAIQSGTTDTIKSGMDDLQKAMYAVSEKLYKASAPQDQQQPPYGAPGAGPQAGGQQGGANGDVYDADYKDVD